MIEKWNETEKKKLQIYVLVAYGAPILMGFLMGFSYFQGNDVTAFGNVQMYYPMAGVILGVLLTVGKGGNVPRKFYIAFLATTVILMLTAAASVVFPSPDWLLYSQISLIVCTIICGILLLCEKKETRVQYGLQFGGKKKGMSLLMVLLFMVLYILRLFAGNVITGSVNEFVAVFTDPYTYIVMFSLIINFFLSFTAFLGEEYGWRYFLQPLLQKRFGLRKGVLILGVVWGLWHLPLNIFYYSASGTWLISLLMQIITCISLGIFFGYAYMKTGNIWVPTIMHFYNNNMIAVLTGSADISGVVYQWSDVLVSLAIDLIFIVFIFSKEYKKKEAV